MSKHTPFRRSVSFWLPLLALILGARSARAQVREVDVGVTPTCPYGIGACWAAPTRRSGAWTGSSRSLRHPTPTTARPSFT